MQHPLPQTWDLERFFAGGSESPAFASYLETLDEESKAFRARAEAASAPASADDTEELAALLDKLQTLQRQIRQAGAFISCLGAQNQADREAVLLGGKVSVIQAQFQAGVSRFDSLLAGMADDHFAELLKKQPWQGIAFNLTERRQQVSGKMASELEVLAGDLAIDGYHAWSSLYDTTVKQIQIPYEKDGKSVLLSAGQFANKLKDADRERRAELFAEWEEAWADKADFCADALNHLAGFRIQLYKHRGWDSVLQEPLEINRMSQKTLDTMWDVIEKNKPVFFKYLERIASLLGVERLSWYDLNAPLEGKQMDTSYDEAAVLIERQFRKFSPKLADFTVRAFEDGWIEAEDRPGKRPGGFCTAFPISRESRVFMTYSGAGNMSTLAHELGHAFHQDVMDTVPPLSQRYAMNVAETASTFAEMIVADAALQQAETKEQKLFLLKDKIQRAVTFFMDIHTRFLFETRFYEERKNGLVGVDRLNELMVQAQKDAYGDMLDGYHPHFWAAKLHFFKTGVPFYNFPYTFGFLFSSGIYAMALEGGESFEDRYIALLQDTGRMTVEELAQKHLGVNLEEPDFWQRAVDLSVEDVRQFLELTDSK